ncbi:MAG: hypothetical protein RL431_572 [Actinomycetota bacterium]
MQISRRGLLGVSVGAAAIGAAGGASAALAVESAVNPLHAATASRPFWGTHQSGIADGSQDRAYIAVFDVTTTSAADLKELLDEWSRSAARMTEGYGAGPLGPTSGDPLLPPDDTGEAIGLAPHSLTVTIGYGASLFRAELGLAGLAPDGLTTMTAFAKDELDPAQTGGDIVLQVCSSHDQVAFHALRNLIRSAKGIAVPRWIQPGYVTAPTTDESPTPRNLFGFKDGTANVAMDTAEADEFVWNSGNGLLDRGTLMAVRLFRFDIETWDRGSLAEQENVFGRTKRGGAPVTGGTEFTEPRFDQVNDDGSPVIDPNAHVRLAHARQNNGARILRRGYNYSNGVDRVGRLDAGLIFVSFQKSLTEQFIPIQRRLADSDLLNEYVRAVGGGYFACPGGLSTGQGWGRQLFG